MRWFAFRGYALWKRHSFKNKTGDLRTRLVLGGKGSMCYEGGAPRTRGRPSPISCFRLPQQMSTALGACGTWVVFTGVSLSFVSFSSVQSLSRVWLCSPMDCSMPGLPVHHQLPELTQTHVQELVLPSNHLILCHPLLFLPSIFPSVRVFSNESVLPIKWPQDWSFSFSISPLNGHPGLIFFRMDWLDLLAIQGTLQNLLQHHSSKASIPWCSALFMVQLSHLYMTTGKTIALNRQTFVGKVMSLLFNMLSRLAIVFLPRSKHLFNFMTSTQSEFVSLPSHISFEWKTFEWGSSVTLQT